MALYRYLTFDGGFSTLKNKSFRLTPPREFNDPFEAFFGIEPGVVLPVRCDGVTSHQNIWNQISEE